MKELAKDRSRFDVESDARLQQIEEIHRSEMRKMEMERKILYKHVNLQKQDESRRLQELNQDLTTEAWYFFSFSKKSMINILFSLFFLDTVKVSCGKFDF